MIKIQMKGFFITAFLLMEFIAVANCSALRTQCTPTFDAIGPLCQNSTPPVLPLTSKEGTVGTWSPASINTTVIGTATYTFTPSAGSCLTPASLNVTIVGIISPTFDAIGPLCQNSSPPALPLTSKEGTVGTWSPASINTSVIGTATYTFTPSAGNCATPASLNITIVGKISPTFPTIAASYCQNTTAPALPPTSKEGTVGTWSPASINTSVIGTATYTFTPTAGSCATPASLIITIVGNISPTFPTIAASYCQNTTAPALPPTSKEGTVGTWSPASINTSALGTATYTFTPSAGSCATPASLNVTIVGNISPTFPTIAASYCQNATAPALPPTSKEGTVGTWSPASINTSVIGTATYTFTPSAGSCAIPASLNVTIVGNISPTFPTIAASYCQNATAPALPPTSKEGTVGTWSPASINTSVIGTATYTFTPTAGSCATPASLNVTIVGNISPTFPTIAASYCQNATAPALPPTSKEGTVGTWSPASINTSVIGTATYTFTPTAGSCATPASLNVTIVGNISPTFPTIAASYCQNATAPALPPTSKEGTVGTWSPVSINTSALGTATYTFTPSAGSCATKASLIVTILGNISPTFPTIAASYCQNTTAPALPPTSKEGIPGTWSPASINTSVIGTATYTFTPSVGSCATPASLNVTIVGSISPVFDAIGPLCQNSTPPVLPLTSKEGTVGTWSPASINTSALGTATYTFTPSAGSCATKASLIVTILGNISPTFPTIAASYCQNTTAPALPPTSKEGIPGTWSPASINTSVIGTATYTFTPSVGSCATPASLNVTIVGSISPVFDAIGPLCQNSTPPVLPLTSKEGTVGTWSPASINTSALGTATYKFTPSSAGNCAIPTSLNVTTVGNISPTFPTIAASYCQNTTAPALPPTSKEGITGTWSPVSISTSVIGTATYTFTPSAGSCATPASINVSIVSTLTPTFPTIPASYCQNATAPALPPTSKEGITGTWSPASVNTSALGTATYKFTPSAAGNCAIPTSINITIVGNISPTFPTIAASYCQNTTAPALPPTSKEGIPGTWSPASINTTVIGTATYTFTPSAGSCATLASLNVTIVSSISPVFDAIGPLCQNSTPPVLPLTSKEGTVGTWSPASINTSALGTATYKFTPSSAGNCAIPTTLNVTIIGNISPTFPTLSATYYCLNTTAPALPPTSKEGINGTWSPASINTLVLGTATYTFTPTAGSCATPASLIVTIVGIISPTFDAIGPLCQNSTPPVLPLTSKEGTVGTWSPASVNTSALGTATYKFTPSSAGNCAIQASLNVTIVGNISPTFPTIAASYCQNTTTPALPPTSKEGINGTWSPASINTSVIGTATYTFTPSAGSCATPASLNVTIVGSISPVFDAIGPLCQNSTPPVLPLTSKEGISGTWSPASINTSALGTATYKFTPSSAGNCAIPTSLNVTIVGSISPTFPTIAASYCQNTTAPALPPTSKEGITGTWSPVSISTTAIGTATYTFTPSAGSCATPASITVSIVSTLTPTFDAIGPLCQNSTPPVLPLTSKEGTVGTWSPASINTSALGTATYKFTPSSAGNCATQASLNVTILGNISPTFPTIAASYCQNTTAPALPPTSKEGINGTWSPASINTLVLGTATYTFTPSVGSCATPASLNVTIVNSISPVFDAIGPLCQNSTPPVLPLTSKEGTVGTWSPASINTFALGTATYKFTPSSAGNCAIPTSLNVTIVGSISPTFPTIAASYCQNTTTPALPPTSKEGITGTWSPVSISTTAIGTATYTFTPSAGSCATPASLKVSIVSTLTPTFDAIGPLCQNSTPPVLPLTSKEGTVGTWSPASINTSALGTATYKFTPSSAGNCAIPTSININIATSISPTFPTFVDSYCLNDIAPALPTTSKEGINGTWTPSSIITTTVGGTVYEFTPTAGNCGVSAQFNIVVNPHPVLTMEPDITITEGASTKLNVSVTGNIVSYQWKPSTGLNNSTIKDPVASPSTTTTYTLVVIDDNNCEASGNIKITVSGRSKILVPNAFSPNGDGINDTWIITNLSIYPGSTLDVFNRYGQIVFHSENYNKPWDGTYNGKPLPVGTYYYIIDLKNNEKKTTGAVTIFK